MGFNIKNNYGPNIEVNAGGKVTLVQGQNGLWHTEDAEEAEYEEVTDETLRQDPENTCDNENRPSTGSANDYKVMLSTPRQNILNLELVNKKETNIDKNFGPNIEHNGGTLTLPDKDKEQ